MVSVGPGQGVPAARFDVRCKVEVDAASRSVRLIAYGLGEPEAAELPIVAQMSSPRRFPQDTTGKANLSPRPNCMTVGDVATYQQMIELISREGAQLELMVAKIGRSLAQMRFPPTEPRVPIDFVQPDLLAALLAIDPRIPVPLFISKADAAAITSAAPPDAPAVYRQIIDRLREKKPDVTTFCLVRETASGVAYQEEFLGFLPGVTFNSPTLSDPSQQEAFDEKWRRRDETINVTCFTVEGAEEIAQAYLQWAEDWSKPFPVSIRSDLPAPHHCKTFMRTEVLPAIDRQWYRELPTRVVLRPLTRGEELQVEATYWRSVGDVRRAELADERLQAVKGAGGQPETPVGSPPPSAPVAVPQTGRGDSESAMLGPPENAAPDPDPETQSHQTNGG